MARRKYSRKKTYRPRKKSRKAKKKVFKSKLTKKQQAIFNHLMSGGSLEEE